MESIICSLREQEVLLRKKKQFNPKLVEFIKSVNDTRTNSPSTGHQYFNQSLSSHLTSSLLGWFESIILHLVSLASILILFNHYEMESNGSNSRSWRSLPETVYFLAMDLGHFSPETPAILRALDLSRPQWLEAFVTVAFNLHYSPTFSLAICYSVTVVCSSGFHIHTTYSYLLSNYDWWLF